jgi:hypothetical protein
MEACLDEIAPHIFRIAVWTGKAPITDFRHGFEFLNRTH